MTVLIFLIVLAVLIFVHELGHFLAAKAFGIRVDAFALGFGPKLISWKSPTKHVLKTGGTTYSINLIPFGGYVKIFGENPDAESTIGPDAARSFVNKKRWQQVIVLVSGVAFNFIFAWLLYVGAFTSGVTATTDGFEKYAGYFQNQRIMITQLLPDSPASTAGLQIGDVIIRVGNSADSRQSIQNIQDTINQSNGNQTTFVYSRNNEERTAEITPKPGIVENKYAVGIAMDEVGDLHLPFFTAVWEGLRYTGLMIRETVIGLYGFIANIFQGTANFSDVAGPVGIAGIVGNAAALGFNFLIMITALISINLGVINLIPFPALDGGRTLFVLIEGAIRRRISPKFANTVNTVGFALLMLLMIVITYKDIMRLLVK